MLGPAHFLLYFQPRIPAHGMLLPAFGVELPNLSYISSEIFQLIQTEVCLPGDSKSQVAHEDFPPCTI